MNDRRRKQLKAILAAIDTSALESIRDDEQNYLDDMPESLQGTERAEKAEAVIDALEDLLSGLDDGISSVEEAAELSRVSS